MVSLSTGLGDSIEVHESGPMGGHPVDGVWPQGGALPSQQSRRLTSESGVVCAGARW